MILRILLITFFVFFTSSAQAWIRGIGANKCGETFTLLEKDQDGWGRMLVTAWIQGYLSGLDENNKLKNTDKDSLFLAVKKRCENEPLDFVHDAVEYVYINKL